MKFIIAKLSFLFFLLAVSSMAKSQEVAFAPIGAEWYYETQSVFSKGYIKMMAEKDTIICGCGCIKLVREEYWHNLETGGLYGGLRPAVFLSQVGDSVMVYEYGTFHKLFDFGAEIGDTWSVDGAPEVCPENYGTVLVVDKGIDTINGNPLRFVTIKDLPDSYWGFGNSMFGTLSGAVKIVERIGPIGSYMLPRQRCEFDDDEGGCLRCYIDNELGELHFLTLYPERACDYISETYQSVDETVSDHSLTVFPNPSMNKVYLRFDKTAIIEFKVFDQLGRMRLSRFVKGKELELDLSSLSSGLYFVICRDGSKVLSSKFFKR